MRLQDPRSGHLDRRCERKTTTASGVNAEILARAELSGATVEKTALHNHQTQLDIIVKRDQICRPACFDVSASRTNTPKPSWNPARHPYSFLYRYAESNNVLQRVTHRDHRARDRILACFTAEWCSAVSHRYLLVPDRELSVTESGWHDRIADQRHSFGTL